jgi:hypothetical protein
VKVRPHGQGHEIDETPNGQQEASGHGQAGDPIDHGAGKFVPVKEPADPVEEESQQGQERDPYEIRAGYSSDVNRVFHSITISSH